MHRVGKVWLIFVLCSSAMPVAASDFNEYWENTRKETEVYARAPIQMMEFGDNGGLLLRVGFAGLIYHKQTLLFARGGLLFSGDFQGRTADLVPCAAVGLLPVFVGVSCPVFQTGRSSPVNYEWGLSAFQFEGKVSTPDFRTYTYYVCITFPFGRMFPESAS